MSIRSLPSTDGRDGKDVQEDKKYHVSHTRAVLLMDKYDVNDYFSQVIIIILVSLVTTALLIFMIQQASYDVEDPLYIEPHKQWSDSKGIDSDSLHF